MRPSPTRIFGALQAWLYDVEMRLAARDLNPRRRAVVGAAKGLVLELGIGTAQNAPFYDGDSEVIGIDPDISMLARARTRVGKGAAHITLIVASAEALPFALACFDSAVVTLALCSVESQDRTLRELHRFLCSSRIALTPSGISHSSLYHSRGRLLSDPGPVLLASAPAAGGLRDR